VQPEVRGPIVEREKSVCTEPVGHGHADHAITGEGLPFIERSVRAAGDEAAAVDEHEHRAARAPGWFRRPYVEGQRRGGAVPSAPEHERGVETGKAAHGLRQRLGRGKGLTDPGPRLMSTRRPQPQNPGGRGGVGDAAKDGRVAVPSSAQGTAGRADTCARAPS